MKQAFHARLIYGGGRIARAELASDILKEHFSDDPAAGGRIDAGTFEDLIVVAPDEGKREITVDKVKALTDFLAAKPFASTARAAHIDGGDLMNEAAQNKLLKVLEEPTPGDLILITAETPDRLLPTVLSRVIAVQARADALQSYTETEEDVRKVLRAAIFGAGTVPEAFAVVDSYEREGELDRFLESCIRFLRDLALGGYAAILSENDTLPEASAKLSEAEKNTVIRGIMEFEKAIDDMSRGFRAKNAAHGAILGIVFYRMKQVK